MTAIEKRFILLVEDDILISMMTSKYLINQGYHVSNELNGRLALDYLLDATKLPDLIISDIMMPSMNGLELLAHLKENQKFKHIPVFAITALDKAAIQYSSDYQFDKFFQKPFSLPELYQAIEDELNC